MTQTVMILGCGEIGLACAHRFAAELPDAALVLHSRRPDRWDRTRTPHLRTVARSTSFVTGDLWRDEDELRTLLDKFCPEIVVDCVPVANVLAANHQTRSQDGHAREPFSLLSRYLATLQIGFADLGLRSFHKVSTAGLGGMGYACPYGHGHNRSLDTFDKLALKVFYAGALHQALVNLADTPGCKIGLTAPKALIGWNQEDLCRPDFDAISVGFGDDTRYTAQEIALCSDPSQFGLLTKESVAESVANAVLRDQGQGDVLIGIHQHSLKPSAEAQRLKGPLLREMRRLERDTGRRIVTTGALGPRATSHLIGLLAIHLSRTHDVYSPSELARLLVAEGYVSQPLLDECSSEGMPLFSRCLVWLQSQLELIEQSGARLNPENVGDILCAIYRANNIQRAAEV